jgi:hypothetical protein
MATLEEALYGLNFTPAENPYGIAATQVGQLGPKLINPYGSTGQAVGIGLGTILLQSLLGYQARSQAAQETLQLNTLANQMQELSDAQARTDFITGVEDPMYQSRLSTLATALGAQERARKADLAKLRGVADLDVEKQRAIDAGVPLSELPALDKLRTERRKQLFGLPVSESSTIEAPTAGSTFQTGSADALLTSPEMQQVLTKADKEALAARAKLTVAQREETDKLRKEFSGLPEVKNYSLIDTAARVVTKAVKDPSAVATQELVRRAVQLIEPGMAVREGEQAAIMNSQSIPDQFKGQLQKALTGEGGLQEDVRAGILRIAQRAYESQAERYKSTKDFYEGIAKERNLPVKEISYLGESQPWSAFEVQNKETQLNNILSQLKSTTDPARIKELKQQAATIYSGK